MKRIIREVNNIDRFFQRVAHAFALVWMEELHQMTIMYTQLFEVNRLTEWPLTPCQDYSVYWPGGCLNIKMPSYQYRDSHVKDKTVSHLYCDGAPVMDVLFLGSMHRSTDLSMDEWMDVWMNGWMSERITQSCVHQSTKRPLNHQQFKKMKNERMLLKSRNEWKKDVLA